MIHAIYLRRRSKVLLPDGDGATPITLLAALQKNLEALGFLLDEGVVERLKSLGPVQVDAFYQRLVKDLRVMVGAHREFKPFYPNFPTQVMALPEAELYFNAIRHYWTGERPAFEKAERPASDEKPRYRIIRSGNRDDFDGIFTLLAKSRSPYSPQDKEDVTWFVTQYRDGVRRLLPDQIPCKENLAHLGAELIRHVPDADAILGPHVRTATDVLRLAVAMSGGDVSLQTAGKFGKFRRRERALLLSWIERAANRTEDMLRWKPRWIRLGERLHPGEYAGRFPQTVAAFDVLRNNRPFATFNGRIEAGLAAKDTAAVMDLLDNRPGELARRLDHLARIDSDPHSVVRRSGRRVPLEELHGDVRHPLALVRLVHGDHVVVRDLGGGPGLAQEPLLGVAVGRELGEHHLEGELAVQTGVEGGVHGAHAALAQFLDDAVRAEGADLTGRGRRVEPGHGRGGRARGRDRLVAVAAPTGSWWRRCRGARSARACSLSRENDDPPRLR